MKNKVTVTVAQTNYTIVSEEDEKYIKKIAEDYNAQVSSLLSRDVPLTTALVLTGLNVTDLLTKLKAQKKAEAPQNTQPDPQTEKLLEAEKEKNKALKEELERLRDKLEELVTNGNKG